LEDQQGLKHKGGWRRCKPGHPEKPKFARIPAEARSGLPGTKICAVAIAGISGRSGNHLI